MDHPGSQYDQRLPNALQPDYFLPDEFGLAERLRMTLAQAARLRFVSADGSDAGHWDSALLNDETIVLADLAAFPLEREQAAFFALLPWADESQLWQRIGVLANRIDLWCQRLSDHPEPEALQVSRLLQGRIHDVLRPLLVAGARAFGPVLGDPQTMNPAWGLLARHEADPMMSADEPHAQLLRRIWSGLYQTVAAARTQARGQIEQSLHSGQHEPSTGLLLALLQLFQQSRARLNRFPDRFTDFYYSTLLQMRPRAPGAEQIYLLLAREPQHTLPVLIPRGFRFTGGKAADGKAIEFAADHPLALTDTRVAGLYTVRLEADPLISPEREYGYATRVKTQAIPVLKPDTGDSAQAPWWPLFGGRGGGAESSAQDAELGLAVASPMLALGAGTRSLRIGLQLGHPADHDESLKSLLRAPMAKRDGAWLAAVFTRYEQFERQNHPPRSGPEGLQPPPDPALLAQAALQRGAQFGDDVQLCFLLARCLHAGTPATLDERLGRLFASWLTAAREDLRPADLAALRAHAKAVFNLAHDSTVEVDDPLILILQARRPPERALIFDRVFRGVWRAQASAAHGWLTLDHVFVQRGTAAQGVFGGVIEIALQLGAELPAWVACEPALHGPGWPHQPVLQLRLQTQTRLYAYSALQQLPLQALTIDVQARGLRELLLHNQLGRLDPSKPFLPFGPLPDRGAYLVLGCAELTSKPVQALQLHIRWGRLPQREGGFPAHYRGYPGRWETEDFCVRPLLLRDGLWQSGGDARLPLFAPEPGSRRIMAEHTLVLPPSDLRRYHRATLPAKPGLPFEFGLHSRNGFFRLDLHDPADAFGHALYPSLLTETLSRNARYKRQDPLPQAPYTPMIDSLTLDYQAHHVINLGDATSSPGLDPNAAPSDQIFHIHPFGIETLHPGPAGRQPRLLSPYQFDGNLYIGLSGSDPQGALSLYFQLRPDTAAERWTDRKPALQWSIWAGTAWQALAPQDQSGDTTQGMLRSGIVTLRLPAGMTANCPHLPGNLYWLRLGADWGFEFFAGLQGVYAQALRATRASPATAADPSEPLPAGTVRNAERNLSGLRGVQQIGPSFGRAAADPPTLLRARSAERLRHKNRALTVWDYERLLLDRYPEVYKVKCFPHLHLPQQRRAVTAAAANRPGHVLVVAVPKPRASAVFDHSQAPRFDAAVLEEMAAYLRGLAPDGAHIVVRNPAYERIQVRAALRLSRDSQPGAVLRQLNRALLAYLSPWQEGGCSARFGWQVQLDAVAAHLRAQDGVEAVGQLSLLHIVRSDQNLYALDDSARRNGAADVRPTQPWSLALPTRRHLLDLIADPAGRAPRSTGVAKLEIGNTFIIGRRAHDQ